MTEYKANLHGFRPSYLPSPFFFFPGRKRPGFFFEGRPFFFLFFFPPEPLFSFWGGGVAKGWQKGSPDYGHGPGLPPFFFPFLFFFKSPPGPARNAMRDAERFTGGLDHTPPSPFPSFFLSSFPFCPARVIAERLNGHGTLVVPSFLSFLFFSFPIALRRRRLGTRGVVTVTLPLGPLLFSFFFSIP